MRESGIRKSAKPVGGSPAAEGDEAEPVGPRRARRHVAAVMAEVIGAGIIEPREVIEKMPYAVTRSLCAVPSYRSPLDKSAAACTAGESSTEAEKRSGARGGGVLQGAR